MTYSVWLEPTIKDLKYLSKIIKRLGRKYNAPLFTPHITVYSNIARYTQASRAVDACANFSKIFVTRGKICHSNYLWKTLYIEIKKDRGLRLINNTLRSNLENRYEFAPHISLIYKKLDTNTKKQIIKGLKLKRIYAFDKITIIRSAKNVTKWKKMKTIRLKN
ncbi:MAG: hypothetical protein ABI337_03985 [Nitrososphaera sp.]|jgi:2'-5' RNA ligase